MSLPLTCLQGTSLIRRETTARPEETNTTAFQSAEGPKARLIGRLGLAVGALVVDGGAVARAVVVHDEARGHAAVGAHIAGILTPASLPPPTPS